MPEKPTFSLLHPHFSQLSLSQFRSYAELNIELSPHLNCFTGLNGAGKTNLLDAIHYLAFTRGFRHHLDKQAVKEGEAYFMIGATWVKDGHLRQLHCNFLPGKGKKLLVNHKAIERMSDHIGQVPLVAILPSDTDLIHGQSADRRRFLDMLISQYDHQFLYHLIQYERILQQRNALLRSMSEQRFFDLEQLQLWDEQLIPHGQAVKLGRETFTEAFAPLFATYFADIVSDKEQPTIRYRSQLPGNDPASWRQFLADQADKDRVNGYTVGGVHRDDLTFEINGQSVRNFGSQGQQKTFIIALKLAQYQFLQEKTNMAPLLLLDDLFDKLDRQRLLQIAHLLQTRISGQIFITDTSASRLVEIFVETPREIRYFSVADSQVQPLV